MNLCDIPFREIGIFQYGVIKTADIVFSKEVRKMCEDNVCRLYGTTWACPPAVGSVEECKGKCLRYESALVFNAKYSLEDSFDLEGMRQGHRKFKAVCDALQQKAANGLSDFILLSNEGCIRCKKCTYPDSSCRFPDLLYPSIEGFGIFVNLLAERAGIHYINGQNTVTYFGALLFDPQ